MSNYSKKMIVQRIQQLVYDDERLTQMIKVVFDIGEVSQYDDEERYYEQLTHAQHLMMMQASEGMKAG